MGHDLQAPEDRWALVRAMEERALHPAGLGQLVQVAADAVRRQLQFGGQLAGQARPLLQQLQNPGGSAIGNACISHGLPQLLPGGPGNRCRSSRSPRRELAG